MVPPLSFLTLAGALWASQAAGGPEPSLPAKFERPIVCLDSGDVAAGAPWLLRCALKPGSAATAVVVYFRQGGTEDFTPAPTLHTPKGWFTSAVSGESFVAGPLHYFVEARDNQGHVVASAGDEDNPSVVTVAGKSEAVAAPKLAAVDESPAAHPPAIVDDNDPLAFVRAQREAEKAEAAGRGRRSVGSIYFGFGAGYGYGWHPTRALDYRKDIDALAGTRSAGLVLTPLVGYQFAPRIFGDLEMRIGVIPQGGSGDSHEGAPARGSWALLARAGYLWGDGPLQAALSVAAGAGDGFRLVVEPIPEQQLLRNDSVRGGPIVAGPAAGLLYHLGRHAALNAEVRALAGLPTFAAVLDFNAGLSLAL